MNAGNAAAAKEEEQATVVILQTCPEPDGGVHSWVWYAANTFAEAGFDSEIAVEVITHGMSRPPSPANEVAMAVRKAYALEEEPSMAGWQGAHYTPAEKPEFCLTKLRRLAARMDGVDAAWLAARSPIRADNRTPASFLHALFRKGEHVLIFNVYASQGQCVWTHPGLPYDARILDHFRAGAPDGVWFLSNPVNGEWIELPRLEHEHNPCGRTRRAEENLTDYRHLLVEGDTVDPGLWLAALVQVPIPILSVTTSGGRSVHALILTSCHTKAEWNELIEHRWKPQLVRLGACQSSTSAVRLTRLPCCRREAKNAEQKLLYLNPAPTFTPICELPPASRPVGAPQKEEDYAA